MHCPIAQIEKLWISGFGLRPQVFKIPVNLIKKLLQLLKANKPDQWVIFAPEL